MGDIKMKKILLGLGLFALASVSFAQSVSISSDTVNVGAASSTIEVTYTAGGNGAAGLAFTIGYDDAQLGFTSCTGPTACDGTTAGSIVIGQISGGAIADGTLVATIVFDTSGAAAASYPLTGSSATFTDATTFMDMPLTVNAGAVTVSAGPQGALDLSGGMGSVQEMMSGTFDATLTNSGDADLDITSCTVSGAAGPAVITGSLGATTIAQGGTATATLTCDASGAADGDTGTATLSCDHNGSNASPQTLALTCNVTGLPPGVLSVTPTAAVLSGRTGATPPTRTITVSNTAAAGSADLTNAACTYTGDAEITATLAATTLAPGASATATASCDTAAEGDFTGTLSCTADGATAVDVALSCSVSNAPPPPEFIPTMSEWAMILMALMLAGYAGLQLRRERFDS